MLINLTLINLISSNYSPSPLISSSAINPLIQSSYISRSFSHFAYFPIFYKFTAYSTHFLHFLKTPFRSDSEVITYGLAYMCFLIRDLDISTYPDLDTLIFRLCVFHDTNSFIYGNRISLIDISKTIFENGIGENAIEVKNCNEIYISKTVFKKCTFNNSLILSDKTSTFVFQDSEIIDCECKIAFGIPNTISKASINFNNFINVGEYLFPFLQITISHSYFKDVKYIMQCDDTPMGCLNDVKIVDCSADGKLPDGYSGSFIKLNGTPVIIDSFQTNDCQFTVFTEYTPPATIAPTPMATPTPNATESPTPSQSIPDPTLSASIPDPTLTETPSESPMATPSISNTPEPSQSYEVYATASPTPHPTETISSSPLPSETPEATPTATETPTESATETPTKSATESPSESPAKTPLATASQSPAPTKTATASASKSPPKSPSPSRSASASRSPWPTPTASSSPKATSSPKPTPNIPLILAIVIPVIIAIILLIILLYFCIRKCLDMHQENLLDRGFILKYNSVDNDETTSDRSNPLNLQSDSLANDEPSDDDDEEFFGNRPRNRNKYINQNDENIENTSSSSL